MAASNLSLLNSNKAVVMIALINDKYTVWRVVWGKESSAQRERMYGGVDYREHNTHNA